MSCYISIGIQDDLHKALPNAVTTMGPHTIPIGGHSNHLLGDNLSQDERICVHTIIFFSMNWIKQRPVITPVSVLILPDWKFEKSYNVDIVRGARLYIFNILQKTSIKPLKSRRYSRLMKRFTILEQSKNDICTLLREYKSFY